MLKDIEEKLMSMTRLVHNLPENHSVYLSAFCDPEGLRTRRCITDHYKGSWSSRHDANCFFARYGCGEGLYRDGVDTNRAVSVPLSDVQGSKTQMQTLMKEMLFELESLKCKMADVSLAHQKGRVAEGEPRSPNEAATAEQTPGATGGSLFPAMHKGQVVKYAALGQLFDVRILEVKVIRTCTQKFLVHQVDSEGSPVQHDGAVKEVGREHLFVGAARGQHFPGDLGNGVATSSNHPTQVSEVEVGSEASGYDADGAGSYVSVGTSRTQCFMKEAIFKTTSGDTEFFLYAHELTKGSRVMAADGKTTVEVAAVPELREVDRVVDLQAGSALLSVTPDHRIPMLEEAGGESCDVDAASLKPGAMIFVDGMPTPLVSKYDQVSDDKFQVVKIAFKPDVPVASFTCPPAISSKGSRKKPLRRGKRSRDVPAEYRTVGDYED